LRFFTFLAVTMKKTSFHERSQVIALSEQGFSQRFIAGHLHIPRSTVGHILVRFRENGEVFDRPRAGRPRLLSIRDERLAVRTLNQPKSGTTAAVGRSLRAQGLCLSDETVRRSFRRQGLGARVKRKKPLLTKRHRQKRLQWAKVSQDCDVENWNHVIWSNESKFNVFGSDGRQWCWRNPTEPLRDCHVQHTVKHGGGSIMVWGCMSWAGVGNLHRIDGIMNSQVYLDILHSQLLGTIERQGLDEAEVIFQHDNDPKHTSGLLQRWLGQHDFSVMEWPPQSPDLNPIEHLWNEVDRRLRLFGDSPKSRDDLWEKIQVVWQNIEVEFVQKLIRTMPTRVVDLLAAKGGYTRW